MGAFITLGRDSRTHSGRNFINFAALAIFFLASHMLCTNARTPSGLAGHLCSFYPDDAPPSPFDNKATRCSSENLQNMSNDVQGRLCQ
jgi:hypothetical protein